MENALSKGDLRVGTPIEVRNRYLGDWSTGFEIHASTDEGCVIRRSSDGVILGGIIHFDELRLADVLSSHEWNHLGRSPAGIRPPRGEADRTTFPSHC
jgi:hypothetical protein